MIRSPEFRRNLWLEMTPYRLIGMPLVLGIIFFLAYLLDDGRLDQGVASTALTFFVILTILWGTRMSSESVVGEIRDHTWDNQRMSILGPWAMTWGKLLGSTIYPWYGALFCLIAYILAAPAASPVSVARIILLMIALGLFSQAIGLLASLQAIRKSRVYGRSQAAGFLILGIVVTMPILSLAFGDLPDPTFFGIQLPAFDFLLGSLFIFLTWTIIGISRVMRAELQIKGYPWVWCSFVLFLMIYCSGFIGPEIKFEVQLTATPVRVITAFHIAVGLVYFMAFNEKKDPIAFKRMIQAVRDKAWSRVLENLPCWLATLALVLATGMLLTTILVSAYISDSAAGRFSTYAPAVILFLLRDLGLLLFLNLGRSPKRADMLTILFLVLLYGVIPMIFKALELDVLTGLFWPRFDFSPLIILSAGLIEAGLVSWLLVKRWNSSTRM